MGSVIEYFYTGEYFPKMTSSARDAPLEKDTRRPFPDDDGAGLLVHVRVYTLVDRLSLPGKGELAYARFVDGESNPDDQTIRKPVAAFWATRSYSLRHDAEPELRPCVSSSHNFRTMSCSWSLISKRRAAGGRAMMGLVAMGPV